MLSLEDCLALCDLSAHARGDRGRELALRLVLREFVLRHPACDQRLSKRV